MRTLCAVLALLISLSATAPAGSEMVVWAVGNQSIVRSYGAYFAPPYGAPSASTYRSVWGSSSEDVYVVSPAELLHYDGYSWQTITFPPPPSGYTMVLHDVAGTGPFDVYLAGALVETGPTYSERGVLHHFDGIGWSGGQQDVNGLRDIGVLSNGWIYGVGVGFNYFERRYVYGLYRLQEGSWTRDDAFSSVDDSHVFRKVFSPPGTNLVAVSGEGTRDAMYWGDLVAMKDAGSTGGWSFASRSVPCGSYPFYYTKCPYWETAWEGVWMASPGDLWCCGPNGAILHWTAAGDTLFATGTTANLHAIWGASGTDIYAVGDSGTLLHYDGSVWSPMWSGASGNLYDVFGTPAPPVATDPSASRSLNASYPNPFNPSTTIEFSTPGRGRVALRVFDVSGKLVRNLLNADLPAGHHSVRWDGRDDRGRPVASGTYLGRLEAGKASASIKLLLVR